MTLQPDQSDTPFDHPAVMDGYPLSADEARRTAEVASHGAGGICGRHGIYDGVRCPKCAALDKEHSDSPPVDRCPWCEDEGRDVRGTVDGRIKIGGRYIYRCPENREHRWQDANETPSEKGFTPVGAASGEET